MEPFRRAVVRVFLAVVRPRKFRVESQERFEHAGAPYIILCNHPALVDSLYLILASPRELTVCGAKPRYFSTFAKRQLMRFLRIIKVESRDQFRRDCQRLLGEGRCLLIYPEMGRNPNRMGPFECWAAEVAIETGVPLVCCFIDGTHEGQGGPVTLHVGEPCTPSETDAAELTSRLFERIRNLGPEARP